MPYVVLCIVYGTYRYVRLRLLLYLELGVKVIEVKDEGICLLQYVASRLMEMT
jgi:hypothetical protein